MLLWQVYLKLMKEILVKCGVTPIAHKNKMSVLKLVSVVYFILEGQV